MRHDSRKMMINTTLTLFSDLFRKISLILFIEQSRIDIIKSFYRLINTQAHVHPWFCPSETFSMIDYINRDIDKSGIFNKIVLPIKTLTPELSLT
jgi:hypothetical protein